MPAYQTASLNQRWNHQASGFRFPCHCQKNFWPMWLLFMAMHFSLSLVLRPTRPCFGFLLNVQESIWGKFATLDAMAGAIFSGEVLACCVGYWGRERELGGVGGVRDGGARRRRANAAHRLRCPRAGSRPCRPGQPAGQLTNCPLPAQRHRQRHALGPARFSYTVIPARGYLQDMHGRPSQLMVCPTQLWGKVRTFRRPHSKARAAKQSAFCGRHLQARLVCFCGCCIAYHTWPCRSRGWPLMRRYTLALQAESRGALLRGVQGRRPRGSGTGGCAAGGGWRQHFDGVVIGGHPSAAEYHGGIGAGRPRGGRPAPR